MSVLIGLWLAKPATATSPTTKEVIINPIYGPTLDDKRQDDTTIPLPKKRTETKPDVLRTNASSGRSYEGRMYSKEEVIQLIKDYSVLYEVSPDLPLAIAKCESGYNQFSKNRNSTASGVYQWLSSSWANQPPGKAGISVFDADANVQAAVWLIAHGKSSPWNASKSCWNN